MLLHIIKQVTFAASREYFLYLKSYYLLFKVFFENYI